MTLFQALLLLVLIVACVLLWRILRCIEWLAMFVKGFSEKFVERSREINR
jgi:hypothetical protein